MGISSISGVGRAATSNADTPASAPPTAARERGDVTATSSIESIENPPPPPRFPWLSGLAAQLASAAKQKTTFDSAPVLGDHIDRSA